ncbi:MAG: hypothetical protein WBG50_06155 [Desulfomonilaceae bacterium]
MASDLKEAVFMGKVTAGVTHDLKNVLAIIRESAGLMQDLLALSSNEPFSLRGKFSETLSRIDSQSSRGADLVDGLNKFAHLTDHTTATLDLNEVSGQAVLLSQRFARLRGITLSVGFQDRPVTIISDPLKIQMLLFECIHALLNIVGAGATISLRTFQRGKGEVSVELSSSGNDGMLKPGALDLASLPEWTVLQEGARNLKGRIEPGRPPVWLSLTFAGAA